MLIPSEGDLVVAKDGECERLFDTGIVQSVDRGRQVCDIGFIIEYTRADRVIKLSVDSVVSFEDIKRIIDDPAEIMGVAGLETVASRCYGELRLTPLAQLEYLRAPAVADCAICGQLTRHAVTYEKPPFVFGGFRRFEPCCLVNKNCYQRLAIRFSDIDRALLHKLAFVYGLMDHSRAEFGFFLRELAKMSDQGKALYIIARKPEAKGNIRSEPVF